MKYLCLGYHDDAVWSALSEQDRSALVEETLAYGRELRAGGHVLSDTALQSPAAATTLRFGGGKVRVTDGPFAETKEQLAGFYLIDAADLDDAIRIASEIPPARVGSIEVRPVRELVPDGIGSQRVARAVSHS